MRNPMLLILSAILSSSCAVVEDAKREHIGHSNHSTQSSQSNHSGYTPVYFDVEHYNPIGVVPSDVLSKQNDCKYEYIEPELKSLTAPDVLKSENGALDFTLAVQYQQNKIAKCNTWLRNYAYKQGDQKEFKSALVGPTLKLAPGDILRFRLENRLPTCESYTGKKDQNYLCASSEHAGHHSDIKMSKEDAEEMNTPHNFNVTNFHTHGLWVSPSKQSDNVLLEVKPGKGFQYEVRIPKSHPQGTFWYHAHVHGSTALQVSSGMAGAIIIEGGDPKKDIQNQPQIKGKKEQVIVLQQIAYDCHGQIEYYDAKNRPAGVPVCQIDGKDFDIFGPGEWQQTKRRTLINGQVVPKVIMRPNEIQRWRFIHAGVRETIKLSVVRKPNWEQDINPKPLGYLNQISVDGLNTGRLDKWDLSSAVSSTEPLQPGYRADYLYQAPSKEGVYWLVDLDSVPQKSLQGVPEDTAELMQIVVTGEPVSKAEAVLPTSAGLAQYRAHEAPTQAEIKAMDKSTDKESMMFYLGSRVAVDRAIKSAQSKKVDFSCENIGNKDVNNGVLPDDNKLSDEEKSKDLIFSVDGKPYGEISTRELTLGTWQRWDLCTRGLAPMHPFHIHVNPFYASRIGPDGEQQWVWRDTLAIEKDNDSPDDKHKGEKQSKTAPHTVIYSKYRYPTSLPGFTGDVKKQYTGEFVLHCHILDHEDQGMMQKVKLVESN
ncbi:MULTISPECIES: multicopper oxidase family protein [Pseudoalteromonas]|uniref:multicopper oxidase family protein n=1 Tax=Pseudoalteromonas TaxID=53246 RepID=UPI001EFDEE24|nr:multicopper oxidase domain-containing protein [Pseudoalteromonas sp. Isolate6]MCG9760214.1 multicopper oxidase domain-containing protein [Pseudoalteromonas sp. Isolate6]